MAASEMERALSERLETLAQPILESSGLELVDLEFIPRKQVSQVRVTLDRRDRKTRGSITLEEIAGFNRAFSAVLDVEDPIDGAFELECSSPGLTRDLKRPREYRWAEGRLVAVVTRPPHDKPGKYIGRLLSVDDTGIEVGIEKNRQKGQPPPPEPVYETRLKLPYGVIARANLEIEWKE